MTECEEVALVLLPRYLEERPVDVRLWVKDQMGDETYQVIDNVVHALETAHVIH